MTNELDCNILESEFELQPRYHVHFRMNILSKSMNSRKPQCHIIAEGFFFILSFFVGYILSFGLVRLRTIRLSARVGAHIERRRSRSRGEDVTITDVIIKPRIVNGTGDVNDVMPGSDGLRILGDFWKKAVSRDLKLDEASWDPNLGESSWVYEMRRAWWGQMEQSA